MKGINEYIRVSRSISRVSLLLVPLVLVAESENIHTANVDNKIKERY